MTTKDMNLSLGKEPIRSKAPAGAKPTPEDIGSTPGHQQAAKPAPYRGTFWSWQLLAFAGLAIGNITFMLLTGPWQTRQTNQPAVEALAPAIEQLNTELIEAKTQLNSVQQALKRLQLTVNEQQLLIISTATDITKKTEDLYLDAQKTPVKDEPVAATGTVNKWYINLGSFPEKSAALIVQKQVKNLGYNAELSTITIPNKPGENLEATTGYQLKVMGFEDQKSAESIAARIMDASELSGLWVWKNS